MKRAVAVVAVVLGLGVAGAAPASAHPFGDPQTVSVALAQGRPDVVRVHWKVGGLDDLTILGVSLGLLPNDRVMLDGAVFFRDSDATTVGPSRQFADYMLRRITVTSGGTDCVGKVQPPKDLAKAGVLVDYTCPAPVGAAVVSVKTLTDLDPAYRALATGPAGERAVYSTDRDSHEWVLGETTTAATAEVTTQAGRSAAIQLSAVLGAIALVAGATLYVVRRRRAA